MKTYLRWAVTAALGCAAACGGDGEGDAAPLGEPAAQPAPAAPAPSAPAAPGQAFAGVQFPEGVTAQMAQAGAQLFPNQVCAACHGPAAQGVAGVGPNLTDAEWLNVDGSYASIVQIINAGVPEPKSFPGPMPPKGGMPSLTDAQIQQLAAFIFAYSHGGR